MALFVALAMNFATYFWSDKIALGTVRAKPVSEAQFPELIWPHPGRWRSLRVMGARELVRMTLSEASSLADNPTWNG